jgi:hypothetical protein
MSLRYLTNHKTTEKNNCLRPKIDDEFWACINHQTKGNTIVQ